MTANTHETTTAPRTVDPPRDAHRMTLLFVVIAVTGLYGYVLTFIFPVGDDGFTQATVAADRERFWLVLLSGAVNLVVGVCGLALAGLALARGRGAGTATVGAAIVWLGGAVYAFGVANWAGMFFAATDPVLDVATSTALVDQLNADMLRMWAMPGGGAVLVALGTIVLAVALWRARTVPRWVPLVLGVSSALTFGPQPIVVRATVSGAVALSSIAVGWYAWRRSAA